MSTTYYDGVGEPLQVTDPMGNTTSYTWTPLQELATQTSALAAVTRYTYDGLGNLTKVTDADGHATSFTYNGDNDQTKQTDALGKSTTYTYDPDGNLASEVDANGTKSTFTYDNLNRQTSAKYGAVTSGAGASTITDTYDAANRLTKAVDSATGTFSYTYDGFNDVLTQTSPQGTISHAYNADGLPTSMSVPGQSAVSYTYDQDKRLTKIGQGSSTVTLGYDKVSRPTSVTLPDGITGTTTYNADGKSTSIVYKHGTTQVGALDDTYDADNRISSASGSLATATLPGAVTSNTYNADNELTKSGATTNTYDKDGNLTSSGANTYSWNAQGELTGMSGATSASFAYNPFGQRTTSTIGSTSTSYLYDGTAWDSNVVQELKGTTPTENLLTGGTGQIFQLTTPSGTNSSFLSNPLGSTLALANASATVTTNYAYTPSGAATVTGTASPNNFEFDATQNNGTGLYLMGARSYNPSSGTFVSQDPTGFQGGTTDLYSFAFDDPVNNNDPTGCGCSLGNLKPNPGKLLPPLDSYGSLIGGAIFGLAVTAIIGAVALSAFPVLAAVTIGIWALDGALIGGFIGTACNLS